MLRTIQSLVVLLAFLAPTFAAAPDPTGTPVKKPPVARPEPKMPLTISRTPVLRALLTAGFLSTSSHMAGSLGCAGSGIGGT